MLAVIKASGSNFASLNFALNRLGVEACFTNDKAIIEQADRVILSGVGHAKTAMAKLQQLQLINVIKNLQQPVLGICLGMQLLYQFSEEGDCELLGLIPGRLKRFNPKGGLTVPHMGWNQCLEQTNRHLYFVHSYFAPVNAYSKATCDYGVRFTAAVQKDNFCGVQFHPEKSAKTGLSWLEQFIKQGTL